MSLQNYSENENQQVKDNNQNQQVKTIGKKQQPMIASIISLVAMFITMLTTFTLATSAVDIIPPRGKIEVRGTTQIGGTNYIDTTEIDVEVSAIDNVSSASQIKYLLSTLPISDTTEITEGSWNTYVPGEAKRITLANSDGKNTIYLALKDAAGNTSIIYKGANVEYTIAYNANGGTDFTGALATKAYYGMPFKVTNLMPTRENYYFTGWSTNENAETPSYKRGEIIPANVFVGGSKTITLYAVWKQDVLLSEVADPGDYVNLPVSYDNVNGSLYDGWRVISKNVDLDGNSSPGTVNLVSAGTPLTYYHYNSSSTSITALTDNFLTTAFSDTENYTYRKSGFLSNKTLKEIFTNKYVATNADGTPKVRAMKADDIYKATNHTTMSNEYAMGLNDSKYENLFANESIYWLASQNDGTNLWKIKEDAYVDGDNSNEYGIRPVVQLKSDTTVAGVGSQGDWKIHNRTVVEKPSLSGTYTYNLNEQTVTINNFNQNIMTVTGNKGTNTGTHTATITLKDTKNYEWSDGTIEPINLNWTIGPRDIALATIDAITNQTWLGIALTPTPTIKDGEKTLVNNTDYTLSYSDNNEIGTGTLTATGTGNYKGTNSTTFIIDAAILTVTLDQQGGTGGTTSVEATYAKAMPSITIPNRADYAFEGYYIEANGSGTQYYNAEGVGTQNWDKLENTTLYAKWRALTYTVIATAGAGGSISPSGTTTLNSGASQEFKITANSGYAITDVVVDGSSIGVVATVTISNITANHTISATFKQIPNSSFSHKGDSQPFTAPARGVYKLEVWGAGGKSNSPSENPGVSASGGAGGYSSGYVILEEGQTLYVTIGGSGSGTKYNGGGNDGGGGATHIATVSGTIKSIGAANLNKILIVAGGGGAGQPIVQSWGGINTYNGGIGGGLSGGQSGGGSSPGTQNSGYAFGQGGGKGGGGLYGGMNNEYGGAGGSGYIGGVPQFEYNGTTYKPSSTAGGGSGVQSNGSAKITFVTTVTDDFTFIAPTIYVCSNSVQTYTAPVTGLYKIEAKGAGGKTESYNGGLIGASAGGTGGYSVGYVKLTAGQTIYVVPGGTGSGSRYNGGGSPGGGGATHVAYVSGTLAEIGSTENVLLVAGGGGGGQIKVESWGGCYGYAGGAGGGANGGDGERDPSYTQGIGATSTSGYAFGQGGDGTGGGGGGLYGGTAGGGAAAGGGGSGYIGGVPAITYNGTTYSPSTTTGAGSVAGADGQVIISFVG